MKPTVFAVRALPGGVPAEVTARAELRGGEAKPAPRERIHAEGVEAGILVVTYLDRVDDALLDGLPNVRLVASYGVGVNHVDLPAMARRGVVVTNTPDVLTDATADLAMALLLAQRAASARGTGSSAPAAGGTQVRSFSWVAR